MKKKQDLKTKMAVIIIKHLLVMIAVIFIATWAVGFIGYDSGGIIHLLPITAVFLIVLSTFESSRDTGDEFVN